MSMFARNWHDFDSPRFMPSLDNRYFPSFQRSLMFLFVAMLGIGTASSFIRPAKLDLCKRVSSRSSSRTLNVLFENVSPLQLLTYSVLRALLQAKAPPLPWLGTMSFPQRSRRMPAQDGISGPAGSCILQLLLCASSCRKRWSTRSLQSSDS